MVVPAQAGVPVPAKLVRQPRRKYPFDVMEVGDFFFLPGRSNNNMRQYASNTGAKLGRKFTTRLCSMRESLTGWVLAETGEEGAVLGVGCWRVE